MAFEESASSSTIGRDHSAKRRFGIVEDCRKRLRSVGEAIDHLERFPPDGVELQSWGDAIINLSATRVRVMIELDNASSGFPSAGHGRAVMILLADVKRLEGTLTNFIAQHNLRLPIDEF